MLIKPAEREWLIERRHLIEGFVGGALSVLVPVGLTLGLLIGFTVN